MRRVAIIGTSGSGKSVLARRLGELLGLEVIHLDRYFWQPGWVEPPRDRWRETVAALAARERWVMDGNFSSTVDLRLPVADTIIFMDFPRWRSLWGIAVRWLRFRGRTRPDLAPGCFEQLDWTFLRWVWRFPKTHRPLVLAKLDQYADGRTVLVLRSPADMHSLLAALRAGQDAPGHLRYSRR